MRVVHRMYKFKSCKFECKARDQTNATKVRFVISLDLTDIRGTISAYFNLIDNHLTSRPDTFHIDSHIMPRPHKFSRNDATIFM